MSDLKPSDSTLDSAPVSFSAQADPFFDELLTNSRAAAPTAPAREGLPADYKMRNAHYVDELEARARRLADEEQRAQAPPVSDAPIGPPPRLVVALGLNELTRGLDGLVSCFNLVSTRARPLRERLGLQLAQVEARRAGRVSQSLRVLLDEPRLTRGAVNVAELLQRVLDDMRDELHLARIELSVDLPAGVPNAAPALGWPAGVPNAAPALGWPGGTRDVWADGVLLGVALSGIVGSLVAMSESVGGVPSAAAALGGLEPPAGLRATIVSGDGLITVRLLAEGMVIASSVGRLFDIEWLDRPGGIAAGAALVAAQRIAQLHGGRLEAAHDQAGLVMSLSLPVQSA